MNSLSYYTRQKEDWSVEELEQVKEEYTTKGMTISQIGDLHKRTPGAISYRLKHLKIIENNRLARGYQDYIQSKLYAEIVSSGKKEKIEKQSPIPAGDSVVKTEKQTVRSQRRQMPSDIVQLKNDVKEMKEKIDEILRLMNAVYEFETQEE